MSAAAAAAAFARPRSVRRRFLGALAAAGLSVLAGGARAGTITAFTFTDDASSQVSSLKTYTAKADPGSDGAAAVVNGVTFDVGTTAGAGTASVYSAPGVTYTDTGGAGSIAANAGNTYDLPTGGSLSLLRDMVYTNSATGNGNVTTLAFTGLTAGTNYSARIYYRAWDAAGARPSTIAFDEDAAGALGASAGSIDEDAPNGPADGVANVIAYNYTAQSDGSGGTLPLLVAFTANSDNNSWHLYGVTNEVAQAPEPATIGLLGVAGAALLTRRRRRRGA